MRSFFCALALLPAFCLAMKGEELNFSLETKSTFVNFCQIIQQRDVIYEFGDQSNIPGEIFVPKDSFEVSKHLKSGGAYTYNDLGRTDLMFQIPYAVGKVAENRGILFHYEKNQETIL